MELLDSQKQQLFDWVIEAGFDVRSFELVSDLHERQVVRHRDSGFYYVLDFTPGGFYVTFSPADDRIEGSYGASSWLNVVHRTFPVWLRYLKRELQASDPWAQLELQREAVAGDLADLENTPFDPEELAAVSAHIGEVREYVRTLELEPGALEVIQARLGYLEAAASRMGRIDWRNAVVGVLLTVAVESAAPPTVVRDVLTMTLRGLARMFGLHVPELPAG